ncbi:family 20 glycosylhydrolase [Vibrio chagasii]|nr:family 20 glycosylhydrolase [Vibrio chagasii]
MIKIRKMKAFMTKRCWRVLDVLFMMNFIGIRLVSKGYDVIVSNPDYVYMDMPYEVDAAERGYYWATRATDTRKILASRRERTTKRRNIIRP